MHLKILSLFAALLLLAACETASEQMADADTGGDAQMTDAESMADDDAVATPSGPAPGSAQDLVVNVGDRVFFDFDRADLKPQARAQIERWAAWLTQYPQNTVTIEGHCDERGTREYNLALGERRANAAKEYMVALGVDPNRVGTVSYGRERPAVLGGGESVWSQNRRSVLTLN